MRVVEVTTPVLDYGRVDRQKGCGGALWVAYGMAGLVGFVVVTAGLFGVAVWLGRPQLLAGMPMVLVGLVTSLEGRPAVRAMAAGVVMGVVVLCVTAVVYVLMVSS